MLLSKDEWTTLAPAETGAQRWQRLILVFGLAWLMVGMAIMPAGVSYNPGKLYQWTLGLVLYLPALIVLVLQPSRGAAFWRQSLIPWVLLLLAWGALTLLWGHTVRKGDVLGHNVTIVLFLFAWQQAFGGVPQRARQLLLVCGLAMALVALVAIVLGLLHPEPDGRMIGFGVMANANLAAGGMGAALVWLWPWRFEDVRWRVAKWLAISVLAFFVLLTYTRSAYAAMFLAALAMVLGAGDRRGWQFAGVLVLLGLVGVLIGADQLLARGMSLRPEIFAKSTTLFLEHPWRGLGQGTPFELTAGREVLTHSHNMFSQLAIELGLPGLLLWAGIWLAVGWKGWKHRHEALGRVVIGLWVFGLVLVQFDLPYLIDSPRPTWLFTWLPLALCLSLEQSPVSPRASHA